MSEKVGYSGYRWVVLLAGTIGSITFGMHLIFVAPILAQVARNLAISVGTAANLSTSYVLGGTIVMIFGGVVCDRLGISAALLIGMLCVSVPALLMPWIGHTYRAVLALRLIQGASTGFVVTATGPILALWFPPEERGLGGGLIMVGMPIGFSLGVILSPILLGVMGSWQAISAVLSIAGWCAVGLALLIAGKKPPALPETATFQAPTQPEVTYAKAILSPVTWIATLILFCGNWAMLALFNLVPAYLAAAAPMGLGFGPMLAGKLSLALTLVGLFAYSTGGMFYDKVAKGDARSPILLGYVVTGVFTYLLLVPYVYSTMSFLVASLMLSGWGILFIFPAANAYVIASFPPNLAGRMVGLCFGLGGVGGTIALYLGSTFVARTGTFTLAIISISVVAAAGAVMALFARTAPRAIEQQLDLNEGYRGTT